MADNKQKLTWRDVFDSNKVFGTVYMLGDMAEIMEYTHYQYFCWNGFIYEYDRNTHLIKTTKLTIEDLGA